MVFGERSPKREGPTGATEDPAQGRKGPSLDSTNTSLVLLPDKPRSMTLNFNIPCLLLNYCAFTFLGVDWYPRCMIHRFPQLLY